MELERARTVAGITGRFDVVVANMTFPELEPLLADLVERVSSGGALVSSGMLETDRGAVEDALPGWQLEWRRRGEWWSLDGA